MTGEHGDGLARSYHNLKLFGPKLFEAFRQVKYLFDPSGRMNPGKVTATPSPIESLRYGPGYPGAVVPTFQDFRERLRRPAHPGRAFWRRRKRATARESVARRRPARCVPRSWRPERKSIRHGVGRTRCGWH